jgi:hypothetical protein
LGFTPNMRAGPLVVQRRPGYTIIQNQRPNVYKGKQVIESTSAVREERPPEPSLKRRKVVREEELQEESYSPSQNPIRIEEEQLTDEQIEQIGSQGEVFITQAEIDEGNPQEPPVPSFELTVADFRGRELDPILEQASQHFLSDDNFVKSRAFLQFSWRANMNTFEERCMKMKEEHPEMDETFIQNQVKEQMMQKFRNITPKEGRQMVRAANILLLPNWDIADALIFNSVSNRLTLQDQNKKDFQGTAFIEDHAALVSWSLKRGSRATLFKPDESGLVGDLIVRRVADTSHVEAAHMNVDYSQFVLATAKKEEEGIIALQNKYEAIWMLIIRK